jgi:osmotically-inducible protein OsmY
MKSHDVKKNILEQLECNDSVNAENIHVEVSGKTIKLTGTMPRFSDKISTTRNALLVAPQFEIDNQIIVKFNAENDVLTDTQITNNIQNFLKENREINPVNIRVDVQKGQVTLSGSVSTASKKNQAENIVNSSSGVVDVVNKIMVKPHSIPADYSIENNIKKAFERSALVDENQVTLTIENGMVTLIGVVAAKAIINEICEKVISTDGVVDVVNNLTIG